MKLVTTVICFTFCLPVWAGEVCSAQSPSHANGVCKSSLKPMLDIFVHQGCDESSEVEDYCSFTRSPADEEGTQEMYQKLAEKTALEVTLKAFSEFAKADESIQVARQNRHFPDLSSLSCNLNPADFSCKTPNPKMVAAIQNYFASRGVRNNDLAGFLNGVAAKVTNRGSDNGTGIFQCANRPGQNLYEGLLKGESFGVAPAFSGKNILSQEGKERLFKTCVGSFTTGDDSSNRQCIIDNIAFDHFMTNPKIDPVLKNGKTLANVYASPEFQLELHATEEWARHPFFGVVSDNIGMLGIYTTSKWGGLSDMPADLKNSMARVFVSRYQKACEGLQHDLSLALCLSADTVMQFDDGYDVADTDNDNPYSNRLTCEYKKIKSPAEARAFNRSKLNPKAASAKAWDANGFADSMIEQGLVDASQSHGLYSSKTRSLRLDFFNKNFCHVPMADSSVGRPNLGRSSIALPSFLSTDNLEVKLETPTIDSLTKLPPNNFVAKSDSSSSSSVEASSTGPNEVVIERDGEGVLPAPMTPSLPFVASSPNATTSAVISQPIIPPVISKPSISRVDAKRDTDELTAISQAQELIQNDPNSANNTQIKELSDKLQNLRDQYEVLKNKSAQKEDVGPVTFAPQFSEKGDGNPVVRKVGGGTSAPAAIPTANSAPTSAPVAPADSVSPASFSPPLVTQENMRESGISNGRTLSSNGPAISFSGLSGGPVVVGDEGLRVDTGKLKDCPANADIKNCMVYVTDNKGKKELKLLADVLASIKDPGKQTEVLERFNSLQEKETNLKERKIVLGNLLAALEKSKSSTAKK